MPEQTISFDPTASTPLSVPSSKDWLTQSTHKVRAPVPGIAHGLLLGIATWRSEVDGLYLALDDQFGQFGAGDTPEAAIADLISSIREYAELLLEQEPQLRPALRARLRAVRQMLGF